MICEERLARFSTLFTISTKTYTHCYRLPHSAEDDMFWLDSSMLSSHGDAVYYPALNNSSTRAALHASWYCRASLATCFNSLDPDMSNGNVSWFPTTLGQIQPNMSVSSFLNVSFSHEIC